MNAAPAGLTRLMRDCLLVIQEMTAQQGVCPSYREIGAELGQRNTSETHRVVCVLERRGWVQRSPGHGRSLHVLRPLPMPEEFDFDLTVAGRTAVAS